MARALNDRRSSILPTSMGRYGEKRFAAASFALTCVSVFSVYLFGWQPDGEWLSFAACRRSVWFTLSLMSILLAHEMGHYVAARANGFRLSMPLFIPFPLLVGTLGAIIQMRESPRSYRSLMYMAAAGPLAGLVVLCSLILMRVFWGLGTYDIVPSTDGLVLSQPLVWRVLAWFGGEHAVLVITPTDPIVFGAWIGCLVTVMNLLPFGQLDGGHIFKAHFPAHGARMNWMVSGALVFAGLWWPGWIAWAAVLHLVGANRQVELSDEQPIQGRDRVLGLVLIGCFILCFSLIPFEWEP
jgi:membrane-associated protease RseP (regulator of RpoE activity)